MFLDKASVPQQRHALLTNAEHAKQPYRSRISGSLRVQNCWIFRSPMSGPRSLLVPLMAMRCFALVSREASWWSAIRRWTAKNSLLGGMLREAAIRNMIMLQEELDWWCYGAYGITDAELRYQGKPFFVELGQRAFEIVMARKIAAGEVQTTWFERHGSTPITELPADWPEDYKRTVGRRIEADRDRPQHRPDRAAGVQAPLEHRTVGVPA